jgi:hydroxymethylpyrimidine pyrophosphatase-like HAD family hydrolase
LATDYDGTIAHDGKVDEITVDALWQIRRAGLAIVLVTGRELSSLFDTFAHPDVFDRIVAENGAVVHNPSSRSVDVLGTAPPPALVEALRRADIPISVGHSIVATVRPHEERLKVAIRNLGLPWHIVLNRDSVMALPAAIDKASGLQAALRTLGIPFQDTIGVGDAENDAAFLDACGFSVAVDNALPMIKAKAHLVTSGARGAGVRELVARLLDEQAAEQAAEKRGLNEERRTKN